MRYKLHNKYTTVKKKVWLWLTYLLGVVNKPFKGILSV